MADSDAVARARQRRSDNAAGKQVRWEWYLDRLRSQIAVPLHKRMEIVVEMLRSQVVHNISVPVVKATGPISGRMVVTERSKPGEFPRADTTMLRKSIFTEVREDAPGVIDGYVGMPLDYGVFLELKLDRQFLTRTMYDKLEDVESILTGPIE